MVQDIKIIATKQYYKNNPEPVCADSEMKKIYYLTKDNYLSEFSTLEERDKVLANLGIDELIKHLTSKNFIVVSPGGNMDLDLHSGIYINCTSGRSMSGNHLDETYTLIVNDDWNEEKSIFYVKLIAYSDNYPNRVFFRLVKTPDLDVFEPAENYGEWVELGCEIPNNYIQEEQLSLNFKNKILPHVGEFNANEITQDGWYDSIVLGRPEGSESDEKYFLYQSPNGGQICFSRRNSGKAYHRLGKNHSWVAITHDDYSLLLTSSSALNYYSLKETIDASEYEGTTGHLDGIGEIYAGYWELEVPTFDIVIPITDLEIGSIIRVRCFYRYGEGSTASDSPNKYNSDAYIYLSNSEERGHDASKLMSDFIKVKSLGNIGYSFSGENENLTWVREKIFTQDSSYGYHTIKCNNPVKGTYYLHISGDFSETRSWFAFDAIEIYAPGEVEIENKFYNLGTFETSTLAEATAALPENAGDIDKTLMYYTVANGNVYGFIENYPSTIFCTQILHLNARTYVRNIEFDTDTRTSVRVVGAWSELKLVSVSEYNQIISDISGKQNTLTFDSTPTQNSTNPVTSHGIWTENEIFYDYFTTLFDLIPNEASTSNQLADKAYVDDHGGEIDTTNNWFKVSKDGHNYFIPMTELVTPTAPTLQSSSIDVTLTGSGNISSELTAVNQASGSTMYYSLDSTNWTVISSNNKFTVYSGIKNDGTASSAVTKDVYLKAILNGVSSEVRTVTVTFTPVLAVGTFTLTRSEGDYSISATITFNVSSSFAATNEYSTDGGNTWNSMTILGYSYDFLVTKPANTFKIRTSMSGLTPVIASYPSLIVLNKKKFWYGMGDATLTNEAAIKALGNFKNQDTMAGDYTITVSTTGKYTWFCGTGTLTSVSSSGFAVPMLSVVVVDGYNCYRSTSAVQETGTNTFKIV